MIEETCLKQFEALIKSHRLQGVHLNVIVLIQFGNDDETFWPRMGRRSIVLLKIYLEGSDAPSIGKIKV